MTTSSLHILFFFIGNERNYILTSSDHFHLFVVVVVVFLFKSEIEFFVCCFSFRSRIFRSCKNVIIAGAGQEI